MILTEENLVQIETHITKILPELLVRNPDIALTIEGILSQHFPKRDELARMLEKVEEVRTEQTQGFEQVDQRFEQVDQRFEDAKRDRLELKRRIGKLEHGQDMLIKRFDGQEAWMRLAIGNMGSDKGTSLEDMFAAGLRYGLKDPTIDAKSIQLQRPLIDHNGEIFPAGFETEVDVIARGKELIVFEIKVTSKIGDVSLFDSKVKLMRLQNPEMGVRGILVSLAASEAVQERCKDCLIELIR